MNSALKMLAALAVGAAMAGSAAAQAPRKGLFEDPSLKLGIRGGFGRRNVRWDKSPDESVIKTSVAGLAADIAFVRGLGVSAFVGMGFSDPDGAVFRSLPISLRYASGALKGIALGAAVRKTIVAFGDFETGARAGFVMYSGASKTRPIEGFAVEGEAKSRPKWTEFEIGPTLTYTAFERFSPYVGLSLNWFRGDLRMTESLGELGGDQTRDFAQKGLLRIALGASYELGRGFSIDGEAGVIPSKGRTDPGATIRLLYAF